jgi:hypothetical protein
MLKFTFQVGSRFEMKRQHEILLRRISEQVQRAVGAPQLQPVRISAKTPVQRFGKRPVGARTR